MAVTTAITNQEFAEHIGCHHSMASRLLNGQRLPGTDMLARIAEEYDIDVWELLDARQKGAPAFGKLLRTKVKPKAPAE
jgi:transcriptional regulator with XRE-family HTH domain